MFFNSKKAENQLISSPVDVIRTLLDERELNYQFYEDNNVFTLSLSGANVSWRTVIHLDMDKKVLSIRHYSPIMIQDKHKIKVAELLARVNYAFTLGHFKMNFEEGDVLFEVSHLLNDNALTNDIADIMFYVSCKTFDEYFNLINKVNMGETEPFIAMLSMR